LGVRVSRIDGFEISAREPAVYPHRKNVGENAHGALPATGTDHATAIKD
jgi:hypothetical protein